MIGLAVGYVFYRIKTQKSSIAEFRNHGGAPERTNEAVGAPEMTEGVTAAARKKDPVNREEVPVGAILRQDTDYGRVSGRLALGDQITLYNEGSTEVGP